MRKCKKLLAFGLSAALVMSPIHAGAAGESKESTGNSVLDGVPPEEVVSVMLPTINDDTTYKFTLDPYDLLSEHDNNSENYVKASVYFANSATGKYTDTSDIATCVNKSSCDVALDVDVTVTNVATNPVTFTKAEDVEEEGGDTNVYVGLIPTELGADTTGTAVDGNLVPSQNIAVDSSGMASATFLLEGKKTNFEVEQVVDNTVSSGHRYEYTAKTTGYSWTTAGFALKGACNTGADWTDYYEKSKSITDGENLKVKVIYSMNALTEDEKAQMTGDDAIEADSDTGLIEFSKDAEPKGFKQTEYTLNKGTVLNIPIDLGSGTLKLDVKSVVVSMQVGNTWYDLSTGTFGGSYSNGTYTIAPTSTLGTGEYNIRAVVTLQNNTTKTFTGSKLKIVES